jgi:hypothetical protein
VGISRLSLKGAEIFGSRKDNLQPCFTSQATQRRQRGGDPSADVDEFCWSVKEISQ